MGWLPTGTLTFLFTDIEGSTPLWEQFPEAMKSALAEHNSILIAAVESNNGYMVKNTGDGILAVFEKTLDAVEAALTSQRGLRSAFTIPPSSLALKVRMGVHTGIADAHDGDYHGATVNLASRVMSLGFGGQILLSKNSATLFGNHPPQDCTLLDLGKHRLKGIAEPEHIFQLCHPDLVIDFPPLRSLAAYKHNLPRQLSTFIGREKELEDVRRLLVDTHQLTLLGPGGTGKTRLMLQAAEEIIENYLDGVWLVELAPLTDPDLIPERVASILNIQEQAGRLIQDSLTDFLRRKELLLLLDNIEHLVDASAEFCEHLLAQCPQLTIMVTGREALLIDGETTFQVPSLGIPEGMKTPEEISTSEGVQLFIDRARIVNPDFALNEQNAVSIAEIVQRLDGIPLALELAAARLRMLSVDQIKDRLNDRFRLLTGGRRTALPRQQTLQALIDWSWQLLTEQERILFRRLSVFSGGWTLEAAQAVASDDDLDDFAILDLLDQLVNKSLVKVNHPSQGKIRYSLLESIHQYAFERLVEAEEDQRIYGCHAEYYTFYGERVSRELQGRDMLVWLEQLLLEADNAKAAREWMLGNRLDLALRMAGASMMITRYWFFSSEDIYWLEQVVSCTQGIPDAEIFPEYHTGLAKAIIALGAATILSGNFMKGRHLLEEGINWVEDDEIVEQRVFGLNMLLITLYHMRELDSALSIADQSLALSQKHGLSFWHLMAMGYIGSIYILLDEDRKADFYSQESTYLAKKLDNPWMNALTLLQQARLEIRRKNWDHGEKLALKAAEIFEAVRDYGLAQTAQSEVGHIRRKKGDLTGAIDIYQKTIVIYQERGQTSAVTHQLECIGIIASQIDQGSRAARLLGTAQAVRATVQINRLPAEQIEFDQTLKILAEAFGKEMLDSWMDEGARMSLDEAVSLALNG